VEFARAGSAALAGEVEQACADRSRAVLSRWNLSALSRHTMPLGTARASSARLLRRHRRVRIGIEAARHAHRTISVQTAQLSAQVVELMCDGWPPHSVSKLLFVPRKYFLIPFEGPKQDPKRYGFSEHLWTHPDRRLAIIERVIASQVTGIIQQFIVIFDIFRLPFQMV
jgi:hypothetical protein